MYHCFRMVYENKLSKIELMLLYAYLVIKNNFRGEIIQINNRTGFKNFLCIRIEKTKYLAIIVNTGQSHLDCRL